MRGLAGIRGLGVDAAAAAEKPLSQQITDVLNATSNAVSTTVPILQGKLPPPGYMVDPKTGKFIPNPNYTPQGGSGGGMVSSGGSWTQSLPMILGVAAVIGVGYFAIKRFGKKKR